jgi:quinol-cytochrome oxidoreductase complex cytochrome b subunit
MKTVLVYKFKFNDFFNLSKNEKKQAKKSKKTRKKNTKALKSYKMLFRCVTLFFLLLLFNLVFYFCERCPYPFGKGDCQQARYFDILRYLYIL